MFHFPFFFAGIALYFLPTIIAAARHKTNLVGIFLVNFLLGWSVIGWIVALVWAISTERVDFTPPAQQTWAPQPARRFCPSCGRENQMGAHFCAFCGHTLN